MLLPPIHRGAAVRQIDDDRQPPVVVDVSRPTAASSCGCENGEDTPLAQIIELRPAATAIVSGLGWPT